MPIIVNPTSEPKVRQCNSIEIVKTLCYHPTVAPYLYDLLTVKYVSVISLHNQNYLDLHCGAFVVAEMQPYAGHSSRCLPHALSLPHVFTLFWERSSSNLVISGVVACRQSEKHLFAENFAFS